MIAALIVGLVIGAGAMWARDRDRLRTYRWQFRLAEADKLARQTAAEQAVDTAANLRRSNRHLRRQRRAFVARRRATSGWALP